MKKTFSVILAVILILSVLAGCGAKSYDVAMEEYSYDSKSAPADYAYNDAEYAEEYGEESVTESDGGAYSASGSSRSFAEKMIYSASAQIETTNFDESVAAVNDLVENYGGFLESSYITGKNYRAVYYSYQTYRYAEFVIRVPSSGYKNMTENLSVLGNVTSLNSNSVNITEQYYDSQSRLDTYRVEEERLLSMLEKADTVTDMIDIESRLSEVRYEIESVESRLRNWQNQVDYSTVTITINEVEELSEVVETQRTYWEQIRDGFNDSIKSVGKFFKNLFKNFIIDLPVLIVLFIFAVIIILIIKSIFGKKARTRRKEKRALKKAAAEAKRAKEEANEDDSEK